MNEAIQFVGEHLFIGNAGRFFVVLSLVASFLGVVAYFKSAESKDEQGEISWKRIARISFVTHAVSVFAIFFSLFYIIHSHYFEYAYAWEHSSLALPVHYMISCFWEGQEGSFLLWMFWHAALGIVLLFSAGRWESRVMTILCLSQVVLSSMILGVEIGPWFTLGSSPFELLRIAKPELLDIPILQSVGKANYLSVIKDGTGLNPLLQNYWMVIHPPTLFLGFASSIIPFAFVIGALWKREYGSWIKPALPWTLFCVMILGAGIIMGGFWAYESLSFGGYWAWDPVENASLIPWIIIIAAVHVMHIHKSTGNSLLLASLLAMSCFILVLYATFLTRSGVLNGTSVHAFTDLGLAGQLMVFLFMFMLIPVLVSFKDTRNRYIFAVLSIALLLTNLAMGEFLKIPNLIFLVSTAILMVINFYKNFPLSEKEESAWSREFWMFIGSLILILSAFQIIINTSIPVLNKITVAFSWLLEPLANATGIEKLKDMALGKAAPPQDVVTFYNRWQLPMAIIIALLTAVGQFFKYKKTGVRSIAMNLLIALLVAVLFTIAGIFIFEISQPLLIVLMLTAFYSITGNLWYLIKVLKGKIKIAGGSVAHIGLGLMLIGILVSGSKKHVISLNYIHNYGEAFDPQATRENLYLEKDKPSEMADYIITYRGDSTNGPNTYYRVDYERKGRDEKFSLYPNAQFSEEQGLMPNPDTKRYLTRDVFTHITSVPSKDPEKDNWRAEGIHTVRIGDTLFLNKNIVVFTSAEQVEGEKISQNLSGHLLTVAFFKVIRGDSVWIQKPVYGKTAVSDYTIFTQLDQAGLKFTFKEDSKLPIGQYLLEVEEKPVIPEYIIMKAIVFPYINFLWGGTLVMLFGIILSMRQRSREYRKSSRG